MGMARNFHRNFCRNILTLSHMASRQEKLILFVSLSCCSLGTWVCTGVLLEVKIIKKQKEFSREEKTNMGRLCLWSPQHLKEGLANTSGKTCVGVKTKGQSMSGTWRPSPCTRHPWHLCGVWEDLFCTCTAWPGIHTGKMILGASTCGKSTEKPFRLGLLNTISLYGKLFVSLFLAGCRCCVGLAVTRGCQGEKTETTLSAASAALFTSKTPGKTQHRAATIGADHLDPTWSTSSFPSTEHTWSVRAHFPKLGNKGQNQPSRVKTCTSVPAISRHLPIKSLSTCSFTCCNVPVCFRHLVSVILNGSTNDWNAAREE